MLEIQWLLMTANSPEASAQAALYRLKRDRSVLLVGLGLIGRAVARQLSLYSVSPEYYSSASDSRWLDADLLVSELGVFLNKSLSNRDAHLDVIWCAGQAGISASREKMANEQRFFLACVDGLLAQRPDRITINLVSSAGGIATNKQQSNPYGESKLAMEKHVKERAALWRIFRISSVYGVPEIGVRHGLLATMLRNSMLGLPTTVFASPDTRRDFILVDDVAQHMVARLESKAASNIETIASGRSIGLQNLGQLLEKTLRKKVKLNYMAQQTNQSDIAIHASLLPEDLKVTSLEEGLRLLVARTKAGLSTVGTF